MTLSVLYEDEWLIAVHKPSGLVVHPTYRNWTGTLLNGLLWHLKERRTPGPDQPPLELRQSTPLLAKAERHGPRDADGPRIITRLDKDTSGIVLVALTAQVHARVQADAATGRVVKQYLALVQGEPAPPSGSIALPLGRSVVDRRRVVVDPCGRESRTTYEVLSSSHGRSVVRCELVTGRTHQIRVHMAARGWPIVGDAVYGAPDETVSRLALHAWRITLPHPRTRELVAVEAPIPTDLEQPIRQNRTL